LNKEVKEVRRNAGGMQEECRRKVAGIVFKFISLFFSLLSDLLDLLVQTFFVQNLPC